MKLYILEDCRDADARLTLGVFSNEDTAQNLAEDIYGKDTWSYVISHVNLDEPTDEYRWLKERSK